MAARRRSSPMHQLKAPPSPVEIPPLPEVSTPQPEPAPAPIDPQMFAVALAAMSESQSLNEKLITQDLHRRVNESRDTYDTMVVLVSIGNRVYSSGSAGVETLKAHLDQILSMIRQLGGTVE